MVCPDGTVIGKLGKAMSPKLSKCGYQELALKVNGKKIYYLVHRLIALLYLPNTLNLPQVNHIDANKKNNVVSNLEWATPQEDANHRAINNLTPKGEKHYAYGKFGANHKSAKIVLDTDTGIFYDCVKDAADAKNQKYKTLVGKLSGNDRNNTSLIYA